MDMNAAKDAFAQYLNDVNLDSRQIHLRQSDCRAHRPQRHDGGTACPPGAAVYGLGKYGGGVYRPNPLGRNQGSH